MVHIEADDIFEIEICNLMGQTVLQAGKVKTIDLSSLEKGIYFLIASNKNGTNTITKVIKE